jgi:hypothetical protein
MSDDAKIQRLRQGYQPRKNEVTKGLLHSGRTSTGMDGYQPRKDEETRGYRPTQLVDMNNLKIPKNLRDAAVLPRNGGNPVRASVEPKKE